MRQRVHYFIPALLLMLFLGMNVNAQTTTEQRLYKGDVQPKRERMPNIINKLLYDEYAPAISPDGNVLVYQSNQSGKKWQTFKLWYSIRNKQGFWTEPKAIDAINNIASEGDVVGGPAFAYDGKTLYFHASVAGGEGEGGESASTGDIYSADVKFTEGEDENTVEFGAPAKVPGAVNTGDDESFPSVSADGSRMFFSKMDGTCAKLKVSKRDAEGNWGAAEELPDPLNAGCDKYIRVLPDNQTVVWSSTRAGGSPKDSKDFDLFFSELTTGTTWGEAKPADVSPLVKSTMYSYQPDMLVSIAPNDEPHVLAYFSAYMGASHEIFTIPLPKEFGPRKTCEFKGYVIDKMTGEPVPATVKIINETRSFNSHETKTVSKDVNIDVNGDGKKDEKAQAYSTVLTEGNKYKIVVEKEGYTKYTYEADLTDMDKWTMCNRLIQLEREGVQLNITVIDGITEDKMDPASLVVNDESGAATTTEVDKQETGKYLAVVKPAKYKVVAGKTGEFLEQTEDVDVSNKKPGESADVLIRMYNIPDVSFNNVNFNTARPRTMNDNELSVAITQAPVGTKNEEHLKAVVDFMNDYKMVKMKINAHTDTRGGEAMNKSLSERRAAAARAYLISKGISADRLISAGFGESSPQVREQTDADRSINRRVEFIVVRPGEK